MKTYVTQGNDSFADIAKKFQVKDEFYLKTFHNLNCSNEELIHGKIPVGTNILIPDDPEYLAEETFSESNFTIKNRINSPDEHDEQTGYLQEEESFEENSDKNDKIDSKTEKQKQSTQSDHDGKYFVIQKGMCQCNQGFKFPKFKVTSHQKHYWNDADGQADYLAVTEDDLTLDPPAMPFGNCKLKPSSGGYLPCTYAPSGKWTKTYDKVKVMGKNCVTELSELMCTTGGKITVMKHGQQSEAGKSNVKRADAREQHVYNPIVDFEEFQDSINDDYEYH